MPLLPLPSFFYLSSLHTWVIPAASCGAASPPLPLIERGAPFLQLAVLQRVSRQVADLQTAELTQEITERHPKRQKQVNFSDNVGTHWFYLIFLSKS